jgi:hypothetical protein
MLFFAFYYQQVNFPYCFQIIFVSCHYQRIFISSWFLLLIMLFCCRTRTNNTWLLENWRSNHGDFTGGTIPGSSGMWSHRSRLMSMSGDHMYTLISMSPRMAQDGMWAFPSSNVTVMHSVFTFFCPVLLCIVGWWCTLVLVISNLLLTRLAGAKESRMTSHLSTTTWRMSYQYKQTRVPWQ